MKTHWHTGTLFIQAWKYKWSYNFDHCIKCWTCNFKHKGKGICTSCHDKERAKWRTRKQTLKKSNSKWIETSREQFNEYQKKWHKEYYEKNKEVINLIRAWQRYKKQGKPVLIISWKPIPFMELIKPKSTRDPRYEEWKKNDILFTKLKLFLEK